ncbi:MAG: Hpt domain-containing protein, partial [Rhodocyclaceae bacterium]|nr:Hpt domain-containing protein [Rhodocyclaceae bacterium]
MATELDIGPLTWVKGEIDLAFERASEALGQFAGSQEAKQIALARNQLRQARGALTIVGLAGVTQFAEAIEALLAGFEDGSVETSPQAIEAGRKSLNAIRHYLDDLVDGWPDQPLRLLPVYRELAQARGLPEPLPTELFFPDLTLRPPRRVHEPVPLGAETLKARIKTACVDFQRGLLKLLKHDPRGPARMRDAVAIVEMTQTQAAPRGFWWASMAFFDALATGGIVADGSVNKLCGRIEGQLRKMLGGASKVPDRLMRDVLYYVARAPRGADHLEAVRAAYQLGGLIPGVGETQDITPLKPLLRTSRDLLATTKDHWNRYCAGTTVALAQFHDGATQIAARVAELGQTDIARLAAALRETAEAIHAAPERHNDVYAIEVATGLLLLEAALENFSEIGDEFTHQVDTVAGRLSALLRGEELSTLELPQLDEMSRKAQERLLMHQVAKEILVSLAVIEQTLDAFFRNPVQREELAQLTKPLNQITGALTVLGQDRAVEVLRECGTRIASFRDEMYMPEQTDFEEVAAMLSGLGFFVEKLQFGAADIDAILNPVPVTAPADDAVGSSLEQEIYKALTQTQILATQLKSTPYAEQGGLRKELKQNLETLREDAQLIADHGLADQASFAISAIDNDQTAVAIEATLEIKGEKVLPAPVAPSAETVRLAASSNAEIDAEILSIFLEEGHEVLATIAAALPQLAKQPHDRETLTTVRRSFHTLKGSGRMVGLTDLGETAWAVEQTLNRWLQEEKPAAPPLLAMLEDARALFQDWVAQLEADGGAWRDATALVAECERLRSLLEALPEATEEAATVPAEPAEATDEYPAADLVAQAVADGMTEPLGAPAEILAPEPADEVLPDLLAEPPAEPLPETVMVGDLEISRTLHELYVA